jgi:hypothetical protein
MCLIPFLCKPPALLLDSLGMFFNGRQAQNGHPGTSARNRNRNVPLSVSLYVIVKRVRRLKGTQPSQLTESRPTMATDDEPEMKPMSLYLWLLRLWWLVRLSVAVSPSHAFVSIPTLDIQIYVPSLADEGKIFVVTQCYSAEWRLQKQYFPRSLYRRSV